ncbi:hypothetical protein C440_06612 [Haloferax mucosum ATCC BAA-1512]|uniref:Uncharacterized protein n=1 Tax=Haloferax mucosum ATCC BAA-1512 TaxID=662479 RepID=M0IGQ0_9EURY|nr:hypothetical protein [Haloferax mucosum]ELZ95941.1 hypothetical protein C440_06612 [Haloferax mucosum ATCC BAA-1512]
MSSRSPRFIDEAHGLWSVAASCMALVQISIPDVSEVIRGAIKWLLVNTVEGILDALTIIFSFGFETFLFYPNPATVPILDTIWKLSLGAYAVLAGLSFLYILLISQYFPGTDAADLQYHLEQTTKYFVVVFVSRELIAFFAAFTNTLAGVYYRSSYDPSLGVSMIRQSMDSMTIFVGFQWGLLASILLFIAGVGLILLLVARMLIIFTTYALLPLLLGLKLVEVGPWSRLNDLGEKFITTSAKLMLYGLFVTALIWTSTLLTGLGTYDPPSDGSFAGGESLDATAPDAAFAASNPLPTVLKDFFFLVTPLLIIDFVGFQLVIELI